MSKFSRRITIFAIGLAALASAAPAHADTGPVFVVPSRPGVPIVINGRDASWSVVEGDIGLARPGHLTPVIIGGGRPLPPRWSYYDRIPYHPRYGVAPPRGRHEIEPPADRPMPEPAEPFFRSWSTSSQPQYSQQRYSEPRDKSQSYQSESYRSESEYLPPTIEDPLQQPPPAIVVVPHRGRRP
jgi:hypothetical protein